MKTDYNRFQQWVLFAKLMLGAQKNMTADTDVFLSRLATVIFMDIADLQIYAIKDKTAPARKYSVGVEHNTFVFRGWRAKQIFNRAKSALQRQ